MKVKTSLTLTPTREPPSRGGGSAGYAGGKKQRRSGSGEGGSGGGGSGGDGSGGGESGKDDPIGLNKKCSGAPRSMNECPKASNEQNEMAGTEYVKLLHDGKSK